MTAARLGVSRNDSPTRACLSLMNCSKKGHCPNSHQHGHSETHGEVTPQAGHASHRKTNSHAQAASQCRPAHPRAPDRGRGRAADGGGPEEPLGASGRHDDPWWPTGMASGRPSLSTCAGIRSSSRRRRCTSAGSSRVRPAPIRSSGTSYGRCGGSSASRSPSRPSCSPQSAEHPSAPLASPAWSSGRELRRGLGFKAHPHMLRHACGYALANKGHDTRALQAYLGHRNIQHTVRYTELSPTRFKDFWRN